ncbi:ECs_2282 family putative zinc-binding protein [Rahnella inusitata]
MSETFQVKFACPDCGSESFIFSAEPYTMDNVESCASCGRAITNDDVVNQSDEFAKKRADEMVRKSFNGRLK